MQLTKTLTRGDLLKFVFTPLMRCQNLPRCLFGATKLGQHFGRKSAGLHDRNAAPGAGDIQRSASRTQLFDDVWDG